MKFVNVHQRLLHASPERVAQLIASLGSPDDKLWPHTGFPRMVLDRPLAVGATGGHGPIRYTCDAYEPGSYVRFRFKHIDGWHRFEILDATEQHCVLEHRMDIDAHGKMLLNWVFVIRPLHDACLEDMLSQAETSLGHESRVVPWSPYVRFLMRRLARRSENRTRKAGHAA